MTNQENRILLELQTKGIINPLTAWTRFGVYRLSAVIFNLKEKGFHIQTNRKAIKNRFDEKVNFAEYKYLGDFALMSKAEKNAI